MGKMKKKYYRKMFHKRHHQILKLKLHKQWALQHNKEQNNDSKHKIIFTQMFVLFAFKNHEKFYMLFIFWFAIRFSFFKWRRISLEWRGKTWKGEASLLLYIFISFDWMNEETFVFWLIKRCLSLCIPNTSQ